MTTDIAVGARPEAQEVTLTGVAHGGEAVGRVGDLVTFVSYALPGERVSAEILERKQRFQRGRTTGVLEAAPERMTPPCPIFGTCGGCHWQHASYDAQLRFKTDVLRDQLQRLGRFTDPHVLDAIPSPLEWHYRNNVQFLPAVPGPGGVPTASAQTDGSGTRLLCFQRAHSNDPVPVEHCYISDQLVNRTLAEVPWDALSDRSWATLAEVNVRVMAEQAPSPEERGQGDPGRGSVMITFVGNEPMPEGSFRRFVREARKAFPELAGVHAAVLERNVERKTMDTVFLPEQSIGVSRLTYALGGRSFSVPPGAFFQVNLGAAEHLVSTAVNWLAPEKTDSVIDLYGGVGTFAVAMADRAQTVTLVETDPAATEAAAENARTSGVGNVAIVRRRVERALKVTTDGADLVLLDPPRRGCGPEVVQELARLRPKRVAYVSCEPSTLARDLRQLAESGYRLVQSRVVDMFPQTYHLESVTLMEAL